MTQNIASFALAEYIVLGWEKKPQKLETWNQRFIIPTNNLNEADSGFVTSELAKDFKRPQI